MKRVRTLTAICLLLGACLAAGCEGALMPEAPAQASDSKGGKVVFSLPIQAVTRAAAGRQTPSEQAVASLLAVAFQPDATQSGVTRTDGQTALDEASTPFYAAVPVDLTLVALRADTDKADFSFELGEEGTFRVCFLANARQDLAEALMALQPGAISLGDFKGKLIDQAPDGSETDGGLLMTSSYFQLTTSFTIPQDLGEVTLTRAMARIDLENAADGIEVKSIRFHNRADKTRLFNDNGSAFGTDCLQNDIKEYDLTDSPLVGSVEQPATLASTLYTYEQLATNTGEVPYLDIRYTMPTVSSEREYSHKVYFDTTDGQTLPLKRNTLYHVRMVNKGAQLAFTVEVADWAGETGVTVDDDMLIDGVTKAVPSR